MKKPKYVLDEDIQKCFNVQYADNLVVLHLDRTVIQASQQILIDIDLSPYEGER